MESNTLKKMASSGVNKSTLQIAKPLFHFGHFFVLATWLFLAFVELKNNISLYTHILYVPSKSREYFCLVVATATLHSREKQIAANHNDIQLIWTLETGNSCPLYSATRSLYFLPLFFLTCLWHSNLQLSASFHSGQVWPRVMASLTLLPRNALPWADLWGRQAWAAKEAKASHLRRCLGRNLLIFLLYWPGHFSHEYQKLTDK